MYIGRRRNEMPPHLFAVADEAYRNMQNDLLEKSRVIKQAPGERCYHIFYQIYSGAVKGLKERLMLTRPIKEYHFVAQAETTIDGVDDKEEMLITDVRRG
ncbi:hypothetical protein TELCIR_13894 [Teladorsagia circumcincta]|uniref:Myosin motor domain-containing protein n=1 Tax=Teladorsagia circumcincta TaxID=45464 RepID=A0A2G9U2R8_TELCI|nr:hypothetical protein TELCIR_13894 [Teladorsagia circumcincta]